jgi:hypothetical protein
MVRRRRNSILFFLCFQAIAVVIICCGSLINFHQYKIWGKPLIPNFIGYKRDIEKYSKTLSHSKLSIDHKHLLKDFTGSDFDLPGETLHTTYGSGFSYYIDPFERIPDSNRFFSSGLRGPPIS